MKTAITATGKETSSLFDLRFGRAQYFCVYDEDTGDITFYDNENVNAQGGAGTRSAEKMMELGVKKVISGDFGPKAKDLLSRLKIQMVTISDGGKKVTDIINMLKS